VRGENKIGRAAMKGITSLVQLSGLIARGASESGAYQQQIGGNQRGKEQRDKTHTPLWARRINGTKRDGGKRRQVISQSRNILENNNKGGEVGMPERKIW